MLVISKKTVERHRANILEKLGMRDRVELTRYAIRRGLVQALTCTLHDADVRSAPHRLDDAVAHTSGHASHRPPG